MNQTTSDLVAWLVVIALALIIVQAPTSIQRQYRRGNVLRVTLQLLATAGAALMLLSMFHLVDIPAPHNPDSRIQRLFEPTPTRTNNKPQPGIGPRP
jgi:hypothetical protein